MVIKVPCSKYVLVETEMVERSAVHEIPRQTKAERQWAGVQGSSRGIELGFSQQQGLCISPGRKRGGTGGGGQNRGPRGTFKPKLFNNIKWC